MNRTVAGFAFTAIWSVLAVVVYLQIVEASDGLSEIGSYFSGVVAPIAFLWFIIGYYQQGQELRENTRALERQQVELEKQAAAMSAQAQHLREQTDSLNRPYVIVRPSTEDGNWYNLIVENTGRTAAQNLRLRMDKTFLVDNDDAHDLAGVYAFKESIHTFPPGSSITFLLGFAGRIFGDGPDRSRVPLVFQVTATYSYLDTEVEERFTIDLQVFGALRVVKKDAGKELSEIAKTLKKIESSYRAASHRAG